MHEETFSFDTENINVEEIMEQIQRNIKARGVTEVSFDEIDREIKLYGLDVRNSVDNEELERNMKTMHTVWNINANLPLISNRRVLGRLIVFVKRIIRRFISWYINPVVDQQNTFNASTVRIINDYYLKIKEGEDKTLLLAEYITKYGELCKRVDELEKLISDRPEGRKKSK